MNIIGIQFARAFFDGLISTLSSFPCKVYKEPKSFSGTMAPLVAFKPLSHMSTDSRSAVIITSYVPPESFDRRKKNSFYTKIFSECCSWNVSVVELMVQIVGVLGLKLVGWIFSIFYVVMQPPWSWSIKDLNLDILKIEAARWKDTVSKCKCKDANSAQFWELIILELYLGEMLNLSEKIRKKLLSNSP